MFHLTSVNTYQNDDHGNGKGMTLSMFLSTIREYLSAKELAQTLLHQSFHWRFDQRKKSCARASILHFQFLAILLVHAFPWE